MAPQMPGHPQGHGHSTHARSSHVHSTHATSVSGRARLGRGRSPEDNAVLWFVSLLVFVIGTFYLVNCGLRSPDDLHPRDCDMLYVAGKCWIHGESPYNARAWEVRYQVASGRWPEVRGRAWYGITSAFAYPPIVALVVAPWAVFPYPFAEFLVLVANILLWIATCWMLSAFIAGYTRPWKHPDTWLFAGFACFASQAIPQSLWVRNLGPLVFMAMILALYSWRKGHRVLLAVAILFCAFKPQLTAVVAVYIACAGGAVSVAAGIIAALAVSFLILWMAPGSISFALLEFKNAYHQFRTHEAFLTAPAPAEHFDSLSNYWGLPGFLGDTAGGQVAMLGGIVFAVAFAVLLATRGRLMPSARVMLPPWPVAVDILLLMAVTAAFMPLHPYDYFCYSAIVCLLPALRGSRLKWPMLIGVIAAGRAGNIKSAVAATVFSQDSIVVKYLPHALSLAVLVLAAFVAWEYLFKPNRV